MEYRPNQMTEEGGSEAPGCTRFLPRKEPGSHSFSRKPFVDTSSPMEVEDEWAHFRNKGCQDKSAGEEGTDWTDKESWCNLLTKTSQSSFGRNELEEELYESGSAVITQEPSRSFNNREATRTGKQKLNGFIMFLQHMRKKSGMGPRPIQELIPLFNLDWQELCPQQQQRWKDRAKEINENSSKKRQREEQSDHAEEPGAPNKRVNVA